MSMNPLAAITGKITENIVAQGLTLGTRAVVALESMAKSFHEMALTAQAQRAILEPNGHLHPQPEAFDPSRARKPHLVPPLS